MRANIVHPFPPVWDSRSRILILGSFPSVKSRQDGFYYANPRNRFWPMIERIFSVSLVSTEDRMSFLLSHHIALWDCIASCTIEGSSDSSIKDVAPNDIASILENSQIGKILTNGGMAHGVYQRWIYPTTQVEDVRLPSTSPANASSSLDRLVDEWKTHLLY